MTAPMRHLAPPAAPVRNDQLALGMAQLSPWGLSEQWVLRDCGDRHWHLIAAACGQRGTAFHDAQGRAVYAAFCATSLYLPPPPGLLLGQDLAITSSLHALGPNRLGSLHRFRSGDRDLGHLAMISCFLAHDDHAGRSNHRLLKTTLPGLPPLPAAPAVLSDLTARARATARRARSDSCPGAPLLCCTPLPALDFNAAGLLYFPVFSKLAEMARPSIGPGLAREVVYLGNLDPGESVALRDTAPGLTLHSGHGAPPGRLLAVVGPPPPG